MKTSLACANAAGAMGPAITASASTATRILLMLMISSSLLSVRERPQPQFLLGDLPEPRQPLGFHDQKEDDESAEDHQLDLLLQRHRQPHPDEMGHVGQEDRHQQDEAGAEERAQDAAEAADDDHEQHEERERDVEGLRLRAAEIKEHELGAGHPAEKGRDGEGEELGAERADADDLAAMSRSRMAIHARPTRPRTRFLAT